MLDMRHCSAMSVIPVIRKIGLASKFGLILRYALLLELQENTVYGVPLVNEH